MNRARIASNTRPARHQAGKAVREGSALLQGLATCGQCGRRLGVYYQGKNSTPGYFCSNDTIVNGRGSYCLRVGGVRIDAAVTEAFLDAVAPAGIDAALQAEADLEADHEAAIAQWRLQVERARYEAQRAERRYRVIEPENRLVARTLEQEWEQRLRELTAAEAELERRQGLRPGPLTEQQREQIRLLGTDLKQVWGATTTTDRDRKELLRILLQEVNIKRIKTESTAQVTMRWQGGTLTDLQVSLRSYRQPSLRTDEDTLQLVRRLAVHYPDATIAGILNRQGRRTFRGDRFTANRIGNLRRYWKIPRFEPQKPSSEGELVNIRKAADILGVVPSTVHRWILDGFIVGEQMTPGAPWRIRMTDELRARFVEKAPPGYVTMKEAVRILGVSRQTVLQRIKRGQLSAVHAGCGRRKGLWIKLADSRRPLFAELQEA